MSQQINLFNPALEHKNKIFSAVAMLQALLLIALGALALAAFMTYRVAGTERLEEAGRQQIALREARLAMVVRDFAPRQRNAALAQEVANAEAGLRILQDAKQMLLRGNFGNATGYSAYLSALARQSVSGVWLTGLTISGNDLSIEGSSLRADLVPLYINRLASESAFEGKSFAGLEITQTDRLSAGAVATVATPPPGVFKFKLRAAAVVVQATAAGVAK